jgi:hypothetical protein
MYLPQKSGYTSHFEQATYYHLMYLEMLSGTLLEQKNTEHIGLQKNSQMDEHNTNFANLSTTLGSSLSGVKSI